MTSSMNHIWELVKACYSRSFVGFSLLISAIVLLIWNEANAVRTSRSLDEGHQLVVPVQTADTVLPENDGKVVHISGKLFTSPPLTDFLYNVEIEAVRLKRRVQMFQWTEEEEIIESDISPSIQASPPDTTYSYSTTWKDKVVDSGLFSVPFGHENPTSFPLNAEIQAAEVVKIGAYYLSPKIIESYNHFEPFSGDEEPPAGNVKLHAGMYYHAKDIFNPQVGDIRVQFYYAGHAKDTYSVIGILKGQVIYPYLSSNGQELVLVQLGQHTPEEVLATHHAHTKFRNWSIRIVGFTIMCGAIAVLLPLVQAIVGSFSVLEDILSMSEGHFTVTVAMSLSLVVVALSWCVYRPALALLLALLALLPVIKGSYHYGGGGKPGQLKLRSNSQPRQR